MIETDGWSVVLDERPYYARSPFQVALLSFCTFGIYILWWSYYTRRSAAALLDEPDHPFWMSAAFFVPFFNLWVFYDLLEKTKVMALRAGMRVSGGMLVAGLLWLAVSVFGKLPAPAAALSMLSCFCLAYLQTFVTRSEFALSERTIAPRRFSWIEILVVVAGSAFRVLAFAGLLIDPSASRLQLSPYWPFVAGIEALTIAGLVFVYVKSRTLLVSDASAAFAA